MKEKGKIFFDLDGTILDSKPRLYNLFQSLIPQSKLSFEDYWAFKNNKIGHKEILFSYFGFSDSDYVNFETDWMRKIEQKEWLDYDVPFNGVIDYLQKLATVHKLYVVTARQFTETAKNQISDLGFGNIFTDIFVTNQDKEKYLLIKKNIDINNIDWFVGDTGKDIETGKLLGMKTAAVLSGFLNEKTLKLYQPDIIAESVLNLRF
jgi:phosphoglycolate phosphatase